VTDQTLGLDEAAEILGVDAERVRAMVGEDLLHPVDGTDGTRFDAAEVRALHDLGG
jgi:hypothetical protein